VRARARMCVCVCDKCTRRAQVGLGQRHLLDEYDLKKREYLCTTSMTAENRCACARACVSDLMKRKFLCERAI
jgi:hypothetical protein